MRVNPLTDKEFEAVSLIYRAKGMQDGECPTCHSVPDEYGIQKGSYLVKGNEVECDCKTQKALFRKYLASGIGIQYMKIDIEKDWVGGRDPVDNVLLYLDKWEHFRHNGMGLTIYGEDQGTGKTFLATHIARKIIQKGEDVLFVEFSDLIRQLSSSTGDEGLIERMRKVPLLIIDEVLAGYSDPQKNLFASRFEEVVRFRTNYDQPTIITTNIPVLSHQYKRVASLLAAKQIEIKLNGDDMRKSLIRDKNIDKIINMEVMPIL